MSLPNTTPGSSIGRVRETRREEEYYRSLLPPEVVQWSLLELPEPLTFRSLYQVYQQYGDRTIEVLGMATALDCDEVMAKHLLKGDHPHGYRSKYAGHE